MCNATKLPLFAGVFSTPHKSSRTITTVYVQRTVHIRWTWLHGTDGLKKFMTATRDQNYVWGVNAIEDGWKGSS